MSATFKDPSKPTRCVEFNGNVPISDVPCAEGASYLPIQSAPESISTLLEDKSKCVKYDAYHSPFTTVACTTTSVNAAIVPSSSTVSSVIPGASSGQPHATSPPTSPVPAVPAVGKSGLAGGAVAGVAIGMLLAGVLIAGLVFFFLLRRQKRRNHTSHTISHLPPTNHSSGLEKGPVVVASAVSSSIDNLLPQPESDETITGEISKIRDNIKNHVRTYCHSAPLPSGINEVVLHNLASATGLSSSALVTSLSNPSTRQETVRLVFAWVILSKATDGGNADLLPADIVGLSRAMSVTANNSKETALFSKWKTITGFLLQQGAGRGAQDANRAQTFAKVVGELDSIIAPCVQGSLDDAQRRKNLDMILTRAAKFAFLIFSQPGSFQLSFGSRRGEICAFPALLQTIGDQGQSLSPPRLLFEGETVAA